MYSLASTASHLLVGGRDCLQGWDWTSLSQSSAQSPEPAWQISLPGRGEVNCMSVLADEGAEDRVVLGMGDNNLHLVDLEAGSVVRVLSGKAVFYLPCTLPGHVMTITTFNMIKK